jgi:HKD family nuclease
MALQILSQPYGNTVGARLVAELTGGAWQDFRCAVAFAKLSGVKYLDGPLRRFTSSGHARIAIGIDHDGTSFEAASYLAGAVQTNGELLIAKDIGSPPATFHPKVFAFTDRDASGVLTRALLVTGSSNLTEGGLFTNHEQSVAWTPDLFNPLDAESFSAAVDALDAWQDPAAGLCVVASTATLSQLHAAGALPTEAEIAAARAVGQGASATGTPSPAGSSGLFRKPRPRPRPARPPALGLPLVRAPTSPTPGAALPPSSAAPVAPVASPHRAFYIDVTTGGDVTEIRLSKIAFDADPAFFGRPFMGWTVPTAGVRHPKRVPAPIVDIRLLGATGSVVHLEHAHELTMWHYATKGEVRLTIPTDLLKALPAGCILEMRRTPVRPGIDYRLDFLTPGSPAWTAARTHATQRLPNSPRFMGWS